MTTTIERHDAHVVGLGRRAWVLLAAAFVLGVVSFGWPFLAASRSSFGGAHGGDAPWVFLLLLPMLLGIVIAELADGTIDAKAVALLGVLAACGAVLRLPSGGLAGFEPVFFLLIPAGRVFGRGFGFVLGALTLFVSALLTGGVGPWLPFQMFGAAWIGFFAGCLPSARGRREVVMLAVYGVVAALVYGAVMNLWFWPFVAGGDTTVSFVAGAGPLENLRRFWAFHITTSFGFDIPRAVFTAVFLLVAGGSILRAFRRVARRAAFAATSVVGPG